MGCGSSTTNLEHTAFAQTEIGLLLSSQPKQVELSKDYLDTHGWKMHVKGGKSHLPRQLWGTHSLVSLTLSGNKLKNINQVTSLCNLESLDVSENLIVDIPRNLYKLTKLKKLLVYSNKCITLPRSLGKCVSLEEINFYCNMLELLPEEINNLVNLRHLNFASNTLKRLPCFDRLVKLESIKCHMCDIEVIGGSWETLVNLKEVMFNTNKLIDLPQLPPNLQSLDVVGNDLSTLHGIESCVCLRDIKANNNELRSVPSSAFTEHLRSLCLGGNLHFADIPPELEQCTRLAVLVMNNNRLKHLPAFLLDLPNLRRINIAKNQLDQLNLTEKQKDVYDKLKARCEEKNEQGKAIGYFRE